MHHALLLPVFASALLLSLISLAVNVLPTLRSPSVHVRTKALLRAAIINGVIIVGAVVYIARHP